MTVKLFWKNPYQAELSTSISAVDGSVIKLHETIFFAFSGGQESDYGRIANIPVKEARKVGHEIEYTLAKKCDLTVGDKVTVNIDWQRRYQLMRLHFAAELILEIMYAQLKGSEKIGAHIAQDKARIDFLWHENINPLLPNILKQAEAIIQSDVAIIKDYSDKENQLRFWQIPGFAKVPCGGTHIKSTGEVGCLRLKRKNIGKNKERVEIYLVSP
ncbi:MAG: hypothetical protein AB8B80_09360 [Marinicellaceae bacterium]